MDKYRLYDLQKSSEKKIQTTMIGALSKIEKNFGYLWGHFKDGPLTQTEEDFADLWDFTRNEILNQGNTQIRHLREEFDSIINPKKYIYNLGKPKDNNN